MLSCYRHIELNPVRAGMIDHPGDYFWSSYGANAQGEPSSLLQPHAVYRALGFDEHARAAAYREIFRHQLAPGMVNEIRSSTNGNYALGSQRFQQRVIAMLGRRVVPGRSGRPKKLEQRREKLP